MQPSLTPLDGKHYGHYSQLFGVHNSLGEYLKYEGIRHYSKNKNKKLERDSQAERNNGEMCFRHLCLFPLLVRFSMETTQLYSWQSPTFCSARFYQNILFIQLLFFVINLWPFHHFHWKVFFFSKSFFSLNLLEKFTQNVYLYVILWILLKFYKWLISGLGLLFSLDFWNILQMTLSICFFSGTWLSLLKKLIEIHW